MMPRIPGNWDGMGWDRMVFERRCGKLTDVVFDHYRPLGTFWRAARVGERLSPYVSLCCVAMAVSFSSQFLLLEK
jgi:hypothetical protein